MGLTRRTIYIALFVAMGWYFQHGDKDPFAGKSDTERLSLWGSDKIAETIDEKFDREWDFKQMREMHKGR